MVIKFSSKKGFTLPEVIIALAVMVLVIFGSTNLVVSIIRSNTENIHTIIAYGLAQEGLEAVRNIRDSNWLLGANYNATLKEKKIWGAAFPEFLSDDLVYTVEYEKLEPSNETINDPDSLARIVPWDLQILSDTTKARLYKHEIERGQQRKEIHYTHDPDGGEPTPFTRYLFIEPAEYENGEGYVVSSIVTWDEFGRAKQVRLDSEITNWKD
jgi:prepilin-type N-terminal cleavage/methylation domain-containing protein